MIKDPILMTSPLRNFLEIPYDTLEEMNLRAAERAETESSEVLEKEYRDYLSK